MKNFLLRLRLNFILTALLCTAFGIVLIVYPETTSSVFCRVIGIVLVICGILRVGGFLSGEEKTFGAKLMLIEGILLTVIGVFIIIKPDVIKALFAIIIGILLLFHGIGDLKEGSELKRMNMNNWWIIDIIAVVTLGLGILLICRPIKEFNQLLQLVGACLIVDGVSDVVVYVLWKHYEKLFRKGAKASEKSIIEVVDGKVK